MSASTTRYDTLSVHGFLIRRMDLNELLNDDLGIVTVYPDVDDQVLKLQAKSESIQLDAADMDALRALGTSAQRKVSLMPWDDCWEKVLKPKSPVELADGLDYIRRWTADDARIKEYSYRIFNNSEYFDRIRKLVYLPNISTFCRYQAAWVLTNMASFDDEDMEKIWTDPRLVAYCVEVLGNIDHSQLPARLQGGDTKAKVAAMLDVAPGTAGEDYYAFA